ncbi:MAG: hypothetical protein HXS54_11350 [Theionarchaea archaeon]|nr:hypothetical protein [Theionarchaea archaeon]
MKEIFLICLLLTGMVPAQTSEPIILLTNSIDREYNSDFVAFLEIERSVQIVDASEFDNYMKSTYIVILGGNKAPEGVGDIVDKVLSDQEKNDISKDKQMLIKLNVWKEGQMVVFLAGADREKTSEVCQETGNSCTSLLTAIETVKKDLITAGDMIIFLWPHILLTSDAISPYAPYQSETEKYPLLVQYPLKENSWFFWIDDDPYAKYAHPVRFVFFGAESKETTVYNEEWWPVLNGTPLWVDKSEYWNAFYWVYNSGLVQPKPSIYFGVKTALDEKPESVGRALVVNGWKGQEACKEDMAEDEKGMTAVLEKMGFTVEGANTVKEVETQLKKWAKEMTLCNTLIIYITAHGNDGYTVIGGERFTASEFAALLRNFEEGVHIFVVIDACSAGSFIADDMKKKAEMIITATGAHKRAYRDFDPVNDVNPTDKGSEFTSGFTEALYNFLENQDTPLSPPDTYGRIFGSIDEIFSGTVEMDAGAQNGKSNPQLWKAEITGLIEGGGGIKY